MLKAVLFDLDGTLLPMNEEEFLKLYLGLIYKSVAHLGYDKTLIDVILAGTKKMFKNDGSRSNEQVFWDHFKEVYGEEKVKDKEAFDKFYITDFKKTQACCGENKLAREIIDYIKGLGLKIILATNPVFPKVGMVTRLGFVGLKEEDFDYITGYENTSFCKCNPKYYQELLEKNNLKSNDVIFFGNNEKDDCENAASVGIKSYLVGDEVKWSDSDKHFPHLKLDEVIPIIKKLRG